MAKPNILQQCKGLNNDNRLTDNAMTTDAYRFHDLVDYVQGAALNWWPVLRSLFRLERKAIRRSTRPKTAHAPR